MLSARYNPIQIAVLLFLLLLNGCENNKLNPLSDDAVILAFGDSLTYGVGAKGKTYPQALEGLSGYKVINAGISGETTSQGVKRFQLMLDKHSPELVILLEGGNDILRNNSAKTTKQNLARMIEMSQKNGSQLILIGVPKKSLFSDSAAFYIELAEQYNLVFDEALLADLLRSPKDKSDAIHLNSAGYQKLAQGIYQLMQDNGAVK